MCARVTVLGIQSYEMLLWKAPALARFGFILHGLSPHFTTINLFEQTHSLREPRAFALSVIHSYMLLQATQIYKRSNWYNFQQKLRNFLPMKISPYCLFWSTIWVSSETYLSYLCYKWNDCCTIINVYPYNGIFKFKIPHKYVKK